jgi:hypothetical protein
MPLKNYFYRPARNFDFVKEPRGARMIRDHPLLDSNVALWAHASEFFNGIDPIWTLTHRLVRPAPPNSRAP